MDAAYSMAALISFLACFLSAIYQFHSRGRCQTSTGKLSTDNSGPIQALSDRARAWNCKIKAILTRRGLPITALPGPTGRISAPIPSFAIYNIRTKRPPDTAPARARPHDAGTYPLCRSAQGRRKPKPESRVNPALARKRGWIMIANSGEAPDWFAGTIVRFVCLPGLVGDTGLVAMH